MRTRILLRLAALLAAALPLPAHAAFRLGYVVTDLDDALGPGGDLWEVAYTARGHAFEADQGFSVAFDPALHASLGDPPPAVNPGWTPLVIQPDALLALDGLYDALALIDDPSLADPFVVRFVWLGGSGATPGAQPWSLNQYDAVGNLVDVLATGTTLLPEPGAGGPAGAAAALAALAGISGRGRRRASGRGRPSPG